MKAIVMAKGVRLSSTFRFDGAFAEAAHLIGSRAVDPTSGITATDPMDKAHAARVAISFSDKVL